MSATASVSVPAGTGTTDSCSVTGTAVGVNTGISVIGRSAVSAGPKSDSVGVVHGSTVVGGTGSASLLGGLSCVVSWSLSGTGSSSSGSERTKDGAEVRVVGPDASFPVGSGVPVTVGTGSVSMVAT